MVSAAISSGLFFYAAIVVGFRYSAAYRRESRWKIGIETVAMITLITWALYFAGGMESPLASAYLLPVVTSALALGRLTTIAELALIALCQAFLGAGTIAKALSLPFLGAVLVQIAPVALVAYVTTIFSSGIRRGLSQARLLSHTDELTGLYNRRGFLQLGERLLRGAMRERAVAGLLMIDSDNLKAVNDRYGHEAGNQLLRRLAQTISAGLRATDVAGRYGGDEFIVLLQNTPAQGVLEAAERIRKAVLTRPIEFAGERLTCTVSIGAACFPEDGRNLESLIGHADRGLYRAKQEGRDRSIRIHPMEHTGEKPS
jgi:diguanylate cyclase (GGDEF)-like protein